MQLDKGPDYLNEFDRVDNRIHIALAHISRNMIYISIIEMIHRYLEEYYQGLPKEDHKVMQDIYDDLCDIVAAIEQGRSAQAQAAARSHVRRYSKYVLKEQQKSKL